MFLLSVNVSHSVIVWLCDPMNYSPSGFSVHGILQVRSWPMDWTRVSWIAGRFFTTQAPGKPIKEEKSLYLVLRVFYAVLFLIAQSCPTLQPHGLQPAGSSVHGDSLGRDTGVGCDALLKGSSQLRDWTHVSSIAGWLFTIWATREAQEYWHGQPIPSPGDLLNPGIELGSQRILYQLSY